MAKAEKKLWHFGYPLTDNYGEERFNVFVHTDKLVVCSVIILSFLGLVDI
jgi:hypothetical protein